MTKRSLLVLTAKILDPLGYLAPLSNANLYYIFKASIIQCKYPSAYKHALINPIPKVCPPENNSNDFRQISVLPHLGNLLERLQLKLHTHDLQLNSTQYAFTPNRSTVSSLTNITYMHYLSISGETSPTFGHANANFSVFLTA